MDHLKESQKKLEEKNAPLRASLAVCAIAAALLVGSASSAHPQQPHLAPREIGQLVDVVLDSVIPPTDSLSGVPIAKRELFFDVGRTFAAFHRAAPASLAEVGVRRAMRPGSVALLSECSRAVPKPCSALGWGVYVAVVPVALTDSTAVVSAEITWAGRSQPFVEGTAPAGLAFLTGYAARIYLARARGGAWRFVRRGVTAVS